MKISPKKKGQIYELIHTMVVNKRIALKNDYLVHYKLSDEEVNKIDYQIAQLEIPLAQAIMKLLQGDSKEP